MNTGGGGFGAGGGGFNGPRGGGGGGGQGQRHFAPAPGPASGAGAGPSAGGEGGDKKKRRRRRRGGAGGGAAGAGGAGGAKEEEEDDDEEDEGEVDSTAAFPRKVPTLNGTAPAAAAFHGPVGAGAGHAAHAAHPPHPGHAAATVSGTSGIDARFLSELKWSDPSIAPLIPTCRSAIDQVFKFPNLSKVQAATLPIASSGQDCFGKAKTGGGKTLAFLIPTVERLMASGRTSTSHGSHGSRIGALVISPTRELALQILEEAKNLTRFHKNLRVMSVIGGTNINGEKQRMTLGNGVVAVDILVGTPGRIVDHIDNTPGFAEGLGTISTLVMDEADRLLDMGFKPQLDRISAVIPSNGAGAGKARGPGGFAGAGAGAGAGGSGGRHTLLFSATVPPGVTDVAHRFLRPGYAFVDTVGADESATHVHVMQELLVFPSRSVVPALARLLSHAALSNPAHKIIVFFPTARFTGYMAGVFERMTIAGSKPGQQRKFNIIEMHSRKSQGYRTSASEKFRLGSGIMMFSSDVTARGMDYPDVTLIVQVGLTDREQYIHRLGRTARAGKEGSGVLLLADYEAYALLPDLADVPLTPAGPTSTITGGTASGLPGVTTKMDLTQLSGPGGKARVTSVVPVCAPVAPPPELAAVISSVEGDKELFREAKQAYSGWLGFYNSNLKRCRWEKPGMVAEGNSLFLTLGLSSIPMMSRETLGKMGLRGVHGINEAPRGWRPGDGEE
jgi:ATP-dependent RNA helicase MSS116